MPGSRLLRANARLDQGEAAAQTAGPTIAGLLVRWLGAPIALLIYAITYVVDALGIARIRVDETPSRVQVHVLRDIRDGLAATYRHPVLLPLALSTHVWFIANAASLTILSLLALVPSIDGSARIVLLFVALAAGGLATGLENANEMSYRQRAVPDGVLGRVNATGRSVNRTAAAVGAIAGGLVASAVGVADSLWIVAVVFAIAAAIALFSRVRTARA